MITAGGFYIDNVVSEMLDRSRKKVVQGNQDRVFLIDGREGSGKSTLGLQLAHYINSKFNLDNVTFDAKSFERKLRELPKHSVLVFDESFNGLSSRGSLSKENKQLVRLLMECRQQNLVIFLILPSFFLLEKYCAIFRSSCLFHVQMDRDGRRSYRIFNYAKKKELYLSGRAMMSYSRPRIPFSHRFYGKLPPSIKEEEYRQKKLRAFRDQVEDETPEESKPLLQRNLLFVHLKEKHKYSASSIARIFQESGVPLDPSQIRRAIREHPSKTGVGARNYNIERAKDGGKEE